MKNQCRCEECNDTFETKRHRAEYSDKCMHEMS